VKFLSMRSLFNRLAQHMDTQGHHDLAHEVRGIRDRWTERAADKPRTEAAE